MTNIRILKSKIEKKNNMLACAFIFCAHESNNYKYINISKYFTSEYFSVYIGRNEENRYLVCSIIIDENNNIDYNIERTNNNKELIEKCFEFIKYFIK